MVEMTLRNSPNYPVSGILRPEVPRAPYKGAGTAGEVFGACVPT